MPPRRPRCRRSPPRTHPFAKPAPPVYDPGGFTCTIDDFVVEEAGRRAKARGAVQFVVVCGHRDRPKREMLAAAGLSIASEWYVGPVG